MPWNIQIGNPFGGLAAFGAGYGNAKRDAEIETERLQAQQNQRMADTLGESIGRIGAGYAQGKTRRYELDWQAQQEDKKLDWTAEQNRRKQLFDLQKQAQKYSIDKSLEEYRNALITDRQFERETGYSPKMADAMGEQMLLEMPPEQMAEMAVGLGVSEDELKGDAFAPGTPLRKFAARNTFLNFIGEQKKRQELGLTTDELNRRYQAKLDEQEYREWQNGGIVLANLKIDADVRKKNAVLDEQIQNRVMNTNEYGPIPMNDADVARYEKAKRDNLRSAKIRAGGIRKPEPDLEAQNIPVPGMAQPVTVLRDRKTGEVIKLSDAIVPGTGGLSFKDTQDLEKARIKREADAQAKAAEDARKEKIAADKEMRREIKDDAKRLRVLEDDARDLYEKISKEFSYYDTIKKEQFAPHKSVVEKIMRERHAGMFEEMDALRAKIRGGQSPSATAGSPSPQGAGAAPAANQDIQALNDIADVYGRDASKWPPELKAKAVEIKRRLTGAQSR